MEPQAATSPTPDAGLVRYTHWIYGLHAFSVLSGLITTASVVGWFLFGWPSIVAVIMNYVRRRDARGTWLESHFRWQIRTFWFTFLWISVISIVSMPFYLILIGIFMWAAGAGVVGIWVIYRVLRGWLALRDGRTIGIVAMPPAFPPAAPPAAPGP